MTYDLILGPVVGKITSDNKIPILIECASSKSFDKIRLCVHSGETDREYTFEYKNEPMLLYIDLLNDTDLHLIHFENVFVNRTFAQCSIHPVNTGTAIISCDGDGVYRYDTGMKDHAWNSLNESNITNAIHIGDQVYIDDIYATTRITKGMDDLEIQRIYTEEIKRAYKASWFDCEPKRLFLANHSNIMIIDDHDIYDNFTSIDFAMNKYDRKMRIFLDVASRLAAIYQIGLSQGRIRITDYNELRKLDKVTTLESEHTKFIIVNSRLTKTYEYMFGEDVLKQIETEANNSDHKKIVLVDQVSPFIVTHWLTKMKFMFDMAGIDITDHVTYNKQWIKDYRHLFDIMFNVDKNKTIAYVTGDLHIGQEHTLFRSEDGREMHCMTTSPISSNIGFDDLGSLANLLFDTLVQSYEGYTYTNRFIYANNYAIVRDKCDELFMSTDKRRPFENVVNRFPNR